MDFIIIKTLTKSIEVGTFSLGNPKVSSFKVLTNFQAFSSRTPSQQCPTYFKFYSVAFPALQFFHSSSY